MKKLDSQKPSLNRKMFKQNSIRKPSAARLAKTLLKGSSTLPTKRGPRFNTRVATPEENHYCHYSPISIRPRSSFDEWTFSFA